jgi:hypothetical protein
LVRLPEAGPISVPQSKTGWILVVIYGALSAFLIIQAFTCADWVCDLIEFPITFPFDLLFLAVLRWLDPIFFFGSITYANSGIGFSSFRPPNAEQTLDDITLAMAKSIQLYTRLTGILARHQRVRGWLRP